MLSLLEGSETIAFTVQPDNYQPTALASVPLTTTCPSSDDDSDVKEDEDYYMLYHQLKATNRLE